jgi:hypothetical protein
MLQMFASQTVVSFADIQTELQTQILKWLEFISNVFLIGGGISGTWLPGAQHC